MRAGAAYQRICADLEYPGENTRMCSSPNDNYSVRINIIVIIRVGYHAGVGLIMIIEELLKFWGRKCCEYVSDTVLKSCQNGPIFFFNPKVGPMSLQNNILGKPNAGFFLIVLILVLQNL
jgi:hypothetical protein